MEASYLKCQKCGERAVVYTAKVPTRGLKFSAYMVALMLIVACWVILYNIQVRYNFVESGVFALAAIGAAVTIIVIAACFLLALPRKGRVVICEHCLAKYGVTEPPRMINGWNLDKFESLVHKGL